MEPRIEKLSEKILVGKSIKMSLASNMTFSLWQSFMIKIRDFKISVTPDLYSVQVYDKKLDFKDFNPNTEFTKCAAIEISDLTQIPDGFETYTLEGGLYAVFVHKGRASEFQKTFQFIFGQWLPKSEYILDSRAHFELLGDKYRNDDPNSEEEVWIPIKQKK